ncbi:hypothetical protein D9613_008678 [Agrocybe pediades]|uniref:Uncharacterized protein n=1 Tax=Agrocybe pediades TaxID=84607 RepID=A0A8H4VQI4_9AGAR|nr:hypothetical protein D9613_008678 [Agrocybe pediades]
MIDVDDTDEPLARYPPHVSEAEVRGHCAAQAEWLLSHELAKKGTNKLFNVPLWIEFCKQSYYDSLDAHRDDVRWGLAHGEEVDLSTREYELIRRLARFGQTEDFWRQRLTRALNSRVEKRPAQPAVPALISITTPNNQRKPASKKVFDHDSDFSSSSSDSESESESDTPIFHTQWPPRIALLGPWVQIRCQPPGADTRTTETHSTPFSSYSQWKILGNGR